MRVTFNAVSGQLNAINAAASELTKAQTQVSTGRRGQAPSDDPSAVQSIVGDQADLGAIDNYSEAADNAGSRLAMADNLLTAIVDKISQALTTATAMHGDTANTASRTAAYETVVGLRDSILGDVNTKFRGTYLFSGSQALTRPYAQIAGVWIYQGDTTAVGVDIGQSRSVTTAIDGAGLAQGSDPRDLFTVLDDLAAHIVAVDNDGVTNDIAALERAFSRATAVQSRIGADQRKIWDGQDQLTKLKQAALTQLSKDRDANMAEAITRMSQADTTYRAALGAVGTANRASLLDYIK